MTRPSPTQPATARQSRTQTAVPTHIAIIMDGNGRWAQSRHQPRTTGHRAGISSVRAVIDHLAKSGVHYVTLFAFSTENWSRPLEEVSVLLELLGEAVRDETAELHQNDVRILHLGRLDRLSPKLRQEIQRAIELTKDNTGLTLSVAFDYGGRDEIVEATRRIVAAGIPAEEIDESLFGHYLQTPTIPDPDLVIRTGGEFRISNFLLWQSAYSEFYSTPVHWPDFDEQEMERALEAFRLRKRRFGSLSPEE
ncbi:MAG: polyprenyl diphosphate synthase [Chloroflexi bacterium]|nr:polyprenyl diphosphate synthase [Chloroflexota bacterium]MCZ6891773.1 polyprenyl diphosphate synthase [Chloroflexota bacterium]